MALSLIFRELLAVQTQLDEATEYFELVQADPLADAREFAWAARRVELTLRDHNRIVDQLAANCAAVFDSRERV